MAVSSVDKASPAFVVGVEVFSVNVIPLKVPWNTNVDVVTASPAFVFGVEVFSVNVIPVKVPWNTKLDTTIHSHKYDHHTSLLKYTRADPLVDIDVG